MTVLVADDSPDVRKYLTDVIRTAGHRVVEAANGLEAMSQLEKVPVDVAVIDLYMPEQDGFELIHSLRYRRKGLKIIAISGAAPHELHIAKLLGAEKTLSKPVAPRVLLDSIREVAEPDEEDDSSEM
jgi:CheY-like chemotaxis protein